MAGAGFVTATLPCPGLVIAMSSRGLRQCRPTMLVGNVTTVGGGTVNIFKYDGRFPQAPGQARVAAAATKQIAHTNLKTFLISDQHRIEALRL